MAKFNLGWLGLAPKSWNKAASNFFTGSEPKYKQQSALSKEQQPLLQQLIASLQGQGAGGAFGSTADYYRDLMNPDSQAAQAMFAPEQRRFQEETIPGISEQFAGMGSGGLSSSGFRNAAINAGTDLQERLGAIRAGLQMQGAQGLTNLGQMGLNPSYNVNYMEGGGPGFIQQAAPYAGAAIGAFAGGPAGAAAGYQAGQGISNAPLFNRQGTRTQPIKPGTTSPYGGALGAMGGMQVGMR